ncbi:hypothetical protein GOV11_01575 [Candidatus Woesearchaeota archaeon]|nr:hypothetical protein [Candidatus Woesearchaeota archaeon]
MALEIPDSMGECVYFTRRKFTADKGKAIAWVRHIPCEECGKGMMEKPRDKKTGNYKVRASEYTCTKCGYTEEKKEHENKLTAEIIYQCPFCMHDGEVVVPYARKSFYGKKAILFACDSCGEKLGITKKMGVPEKFTEKLASI